MTTPYKSWPEAYLRECMADEIELANLHVKWRNRFTAPALVTFGADLATRRTNSMRTAGGARLAFAAHDLSPPPRWRRDFWAAGALAAELGLTIVHDLEDRTVSVGAGGKRRNATEAYNDHPDQDAAILAAYVRGAIQVLQARVAVQ